MTGLNAVGRWATRDEIDFIMGLGTHASSETLNCRGRMDRTTLLRRYLDAMPLRRDWGEINPGIVARLIAALLC